MALSTGGYVCIQTNKFVCIYTNKSTYNTKSPLVRMVKLKNFFDFMMTSKKYTFSRTCPLNFEF